MPKIVRFSADSCDARMRVGIRAGRPCGESRVAGGSPEPTITTRGFVNTSRCQKSWVRAVVEVTTQIVVMAWEYVVALTRCVRDESLSVCERRAGAFTPAGLRNDPGLGFEPRHLEHPVRVSSDWQWISDRDECRHVAHAEQSQALSRHRGCRDLSIQFVPEQILPIGVAKARDVSGKIRRVLRFTKRHPEYDDVRIVRAGANSPAMMKWSNRPPP